MASKDNYRLLIQKLDQFIRKYYINQLIRGLLYSTGLILALFLVISVLEYYNYFPPATRKLLFYSFLGVSGLALALWVFAPLLRYFRLGSVISHEQAATIIGNHFADVKDKLLNILQLKQQSETLEDPSLTLAGIDQKSEEIRLVPFKSAINLGQNRKYLRYALPPLLILLILLFAAPSVIKDSTRRLIRNNENFERPAPFSFVVDSDDLTVIQYDDFPLTVTVEGEQLPNEVFIDVDNYQYRLTKEAPNRFTYRFNNVQKDTRFNLTSSGVYSENYELAVLKKPNILGFEVKLDFPAYTQRKDEALNNIGDLVVPAGTKIDWVFNAENTDGIVLDFVTEEAPIPAKRFSDDLFTFQRRAMRDERYRLFVSNADLPRADSIAYAISVIPDLHPNISVEKFQDSLDNRMLFFAGDASDDYGLLSLSFNYRLKKEDAEAGELQTIKLDKPDGKQIQYTYSFDLNELELKPGDEVSYYFEVYDNDAVNGSKSARTNLMQFAMPTAEEYEEMAEENEQKVKDDLRKALEESRKIQKDMKKMREKLLQEKDLDWQSRKELEKMLERQKELEKQIQEAKEAFEENLKNQEEFSEQDQRVLEKQQQLQEMFEEVMSEEMQELMKQIEELMQQLEKDQALEMMEEFEYNDEEMEKELDRLLELYKQLALEQEVQETIEKLEELAEKQEELSEETKEGEKSQEELQDAQEKLNEEFEKVQEKMENIEEKNKELEKPKEMEDYDQEMEDIQEDMNNSQEQLEQQQNQKASDSQKKASDKMKNMANAMAMQMQAGEMEQVQEDIQALRQLLENLVGLSFDQEDLIDDFGVVSVNTPRYVELVQEQFKLKDDFRLIEDSLQALSKRVFQIESFITEKVSEINGNMRSSLEDLEERRKPQAGDHQQRTMKNVNDLALMLSEVMNQMQQQMSSMMSGNQMCTNPGGQGQDGNTPSDKISQGQQSLNEQMKEMKQKLENGKEGSSKEFAKMAAKQAALRKVLRENQQKLQERGQGSKELEELIEQMDKVETDLVNKKLTNEMLQRQEEILTRLLEHEKAERQRELDQKRKSKTAEKQERKMPPSLEEYLKKRETEIEMYKTVSPSLKPYYQYLVEEYFKSLKAE